MRNLTVWTDCLRRIPWWTLILMGICATVFGALLITRPLSSLSVLAIFIGISCIATGLADLIRDNREEGVPWLSCAVGVGWIVVGMVTIFWLGTSIMVLPWLVGIALIVSGVARTIGAIRGSRDQRLATLLFGLADVIFGLLALFWPDVTLLVIAVLFGTRTLVFGISTIYDGVRRSPLLGSGTPAHSASPKGGRSWTRTSGASATILVAVVLALIARQLNLGSPEVSAFYDAPSEVPNTPGQLVRTEPYTTGVPDGAVAWRILYTTTNVDGSPAMASGIVAVPKNTGTTPLLVVAWDHGTNGIARPCAPSITEDAISPDTIPAVVQAIARGWAIVATDYTGEGAKGKFPYLVGASEAHSTLDAVRAAHQMTNEFTLSNQTAIWGHSQGGHAALWSAQLAPTYAPELKIVGTAALSPASNPLEVVRTILAEAKKTPAVTVAASYLLESYSEIYPDAKLSNSVPDSGAELIVREMAARCTSEPGVLVSVLNALAISGDGPILNVDLNDGPLAARLTENIPTTPAFTAPLFIGQGADDEVISQKLVQDKYVAQLCNSGQQLEYVVYPGRNHMGVLTQDSPLIDQLVAWTSARFAGGPTTVNSCASI